MTEPAFRLTKWYVDATTGAGEVLVGHHGRLSWKGLSLGHSSVLHREPGGRISETWASRGARPPEIDGTGIRWRSSRPAIEGRWSGAAHAAGVAAACPHRLLETAEGVVDWTCLLPSARAEVFLPGGRSTVGLGYAERLELTIRPWRLPLDQLRWGRFLCPEASLVWIEWRGPAPLSLALLDGRPAGLASVDEGAVVLSGPVARLDLGPGTILREGLLGGTVLGRLPALKRSLPGRMLRVHETRLLSPGVLDLGGGSRHEGYALHEVVRWP